MCQRSPIFSLHSHHVFFSGISLARKFPSDRSTSPLRWFILWIMMYHFYIDQLTSHSGPVPDVSSFLYSPLQDPSHTLSNPLISIHTKTYSQTHAHTHTPTHTHFICTDFHCIDRITQNSFVLAQTRQVWSFSRTTDICRFHKSMHCYLFQGVRQFFLYQNTVCKNT